MSFSLKRGNSKDNKFYFSSDSAREASLPAPISFLYVGSMTNGLQRTPVSSLSDEISIERRSISEAMQGLRTLLEARGLLWKYNGDLNHYEQLLNKNLNEREVLYRERDRLDVRFNSIVSTYPIPTSSALALPELSQPVNTEETRLLCEYKNRNKTTTSFSRLQPKRKDAEWYDLSRPFGNNIVHETTSNFRTTNTFSVSKGVPRREDNNTAIDRLQKFLSSERKRRQEYKSKIFSNIASQDPTNFPTIISGRPSIDAKVHQVSRTTRTIEQQWLPIPEKLKAYPSFLEQLENAHTSDRQKNAAHKNYFAPLWTTQFFSLDNMEDTELVDLARIARTDIDQEMQDPLLSSTTTH